jgi:hypothetical protein
MTQKNYFKPRTIVPSLTILISSLLSGHTVSIDQGAGIAGTWHIEPNHNPRANQPAVVWVAVTRRGGQPIPMHQLQCQLFVFRLPRRDQPVQTLSLRAIDAENFRQIPSAQVTFPQQGRYQLALDCVKPQPFRLTYETIVR